MHTYDAMITCAREKDFKPYYLSGYECRVNDDYVDSDDDDYVDSDDDYIDSDADYVDSD